MGREQFSAPEESTRNRQRKVVVQSQLVLFGAFAGAFLGSIFGDVTTGGQIAVLVILILLPLFTNRYWDQIYRMGSRVR